MYEHFYGFTAKPFQNSHNAKQYFLGASQQKALIAIHDGVKKQGGFLTVTGPSGVGKTSLIAFLKEEQKNTSINIANLSANKITDSNLLPSILQAFNCQISELNLPVLIKQFEDFIRTQISKGKKALIIVDDAHELSNKCLNILRLVGNFQANARLFFQVILVGRHVLKDRLTHHNLSSLQHLDVTSIEIHPMDLVDTRRYIIHHLKRVGWLGKPSMSDDLIEITYQESQGLPVAINYYLDEYLLQEVKKLSVITGDVLAFPKKNKIHEKNKDALIAILETMESQEDSRRDERDIVLNATNIEPPILYAKASTLRKEEVSGIDKEEVKIKKSGIKDSGIKEKQADTLYFDREMSLEEAKQFFEGESIKNTAQNNKASMGGGKRKLMSVVLVSYVLSAVIAVSVYFSDIKINDFSFNDIIIAVEASTAIMNNK